MRDKDENIIADKNAFYYYLSNMRLITVNKVIPYVVFIIAWGITRAIDFWSGFVEYSSNRLIVAVFIPLILLSIFYLYGNLIALQNIVHKVNSILQRVSQKPRFIFIQIVVFSLVGVTIYLTRDFRGATSIDTKLFRQSVENSAYFKGLLYNDLVGSQLRAHSNFFLFLLVPVIWLFGSSGWILIQYLHSVTISAWAYMIGWNITRRNKPNYVLWAALMPIGLFLAVYLQNAGFYDTRFAALAIVIFIVGWLRNNRFVSIIGFIGTLITRETTVISLVFILPFLPARVSLNRLRWIFLVVALVWLGIYALLIQLLGGASGTSRIDECVTSVSFSSTYINCLLNNLGANMPLKFAYTARLISFAPFSILSIGAISGALPELGLAWISRDYVFFSLAWHYYMPLLGVVLLLGFHQMNFRIRSNRIRQMFLLWTFAISLWQFFTTVRPGIF